MHLCTCRRMCSYIHIFFICYACLILTTQRIACPFAFLWFCFIKLFCVHRHICCYEIFIHYITCGKAILYVCADVCKSKKRLTWRIRFWIEIMFSLRLFVHILRCLRATYVAIFDLWSYKSFQNRILNHILNRFKYFLTLCLLVNCRSM